MLGEFLRILSNLILRILLLPFFQNNLQFLRVKSLTFQGHLANLIFFFLIFVNNFYQSIVVHNNFTLLFFHACIPWRSGLIQSIITKKGVGFLGKHFITNNEIRVLLCRRKENKLLFFQVLQTSQTTGNGITRVFIH